MKIIYTKLNEVVKKIVNILESEGYSSEKINKELINLRKIEDSSKSIYFSYYKSILEDVFEFKKYVEETTKEEKEDILAGFIVWLKINYLRDQDVRIGYIMKFNSVSTRAKLKQNQLFAKFIL